MVTAKTDTSNSNLDNDSKNTKLTARTEEVLLGIAVALKELDNNGLTRSELARRVEMNPSSIKRHVDRLLECQMIDVSGHNLQLTLAGESRVMKLGVQSQRVMGRNMGKAFRLFLPLLTDEFVRS